MTPRRLVPVILDANVEIGDQLSTPRFGEIASYAVRFSEVDENTDPDDPRLTTITVRVEPLRSAYRNTGLDGTPFEQRNRWSSWLHADGFSAQWVSFRQPPLGSSPVELRGWLTIDFGALCSCWVRGRVSGLWMTYARRDPPRVIAGAGGAVSWGPLVWGSQGRVALDDWPARSQGWPDLPAGANETGMMVELDLDDVPNGCTGGVRR